MNLENGMNFEQIAKNKQEKEKSNSMETKNEKLMSNPEIVIEPEKGIHLMSLMLKGYDPEWGNKDHELAKLTNEYFKKNPLSKEIKKSLDELKALAGIDEEGIDQETLFNISLSYDYPERTKEISSGFLKSSGIENADELQQKVLKLMEDFEKELKSNPEFSELENKFNHETQKDIGIREKRLEASKEEINKLIGFFRPKTETTRAKKINIIPTDVLYPKESGMGFDVGEEIIVRVPLKDFTESNQWTHEFLHSVINPIDDKLYQKLTDEQKEKLIKMSPQKLKQHYGKNANTLLNESFIRTYVNLFGKSSGPYSYEYFKKLIPQIKDEEQFQDILSGDKELIQRLNELKIHNLKEFTEKSEEYFENWEKDELGNVIYDLYEDYSKEIQKNENLTFEDFVLEKFSDYIDKK